VGRRSCSRGAGRGGAMLAPSSAPGSTFGINAHVPSQAIQNNIVAAGIGWCGSMWSGASSRSTATPSTGLATTPSSTPSRARPEDLRHPPGHAAVATSGASSAASPAIRTTGASSATPSLPATAPGRRVGFWNEPNLDHFWKALGPSTSTRSCSPASRRSRPPTPARCWSRDLAHLSSATGTPGWSASSTTPRPARRRLPPRLPLQRTAGDVTDKLTEEGACRFYPPPCASAGRRRLGRAAVLADRDRRRKRRLRQSGQASFYENLLGLWFGSALATTDRPHLLLRDGGPERRPDPVVGILEAPPGLERKLAYFAYLDFIATALVDDADVSTSDLPPFAGSNELIEARFALRNTGTTTWTADAGYVLVVEVDDLRWQVEVDPFPTTSRWRRATPSSSPASWWRRRLPVPAAAPGHDRGPHGGARSARLRHRRAPSTGPHRPNAAPGHATPADAVAPINGTAVFSVEAADPAGPATSGGATPRPSSTTTPPRRLDPVLQVSGLGFDALGDYDCLVTNSAARSPRCRAR